MSDRPRVREMHEPARRHSARLHRDAQATSAARLRSETLCRTVGIRRTHPSRQQPSEGPPCRSARPGKPARTHTAGRCRWCGTVAMVCVWLSGTGRNPGEAAWVMDRSGARRRGMPAHVQGTRGRDRGMIRSCRARYEVGSPSLIVPLKIKCPPDVSVSPVAVTFRPTSGGRAVREESCHADGTGLACVESIRFEWRSPGSTMWTMWIPQCARPRNLET
jgi:hypothetical protein